MITDPLRIVVPHNSPMHIQSPFPSRLVVLDAIAFSHSSRPVQLSCHITSGGLEKHFKIALHYGLFQRLLIQHMDRSPAVLILEALGHRHRFLQALSGSSRRSCSTSVVQILRTERLLGRSATLRGLTPSLRPHNTAAVTPAPGAPANSTPASSTQAA